MNVKLILVLLLCGLGFSAKAQWIFKGNVYDSASHKPLSPVSVEILERHQGVYSDSKGNFSIEAQLSDHISFNFLGYKTKVVVFSEVMQGIGQMVYLAPKPVKLNEVFIKKGPTEYQKDSMRRADIYKDAFDYQREKSITSPVTSIYQKYSKKHRNMEKFHEQVQDMEQQKFIDTRYGLTLVMNLTKMNEDSAITFMNAYPMEYDFARLASDLEIKMWIKYNAQAYRQSGARRKEDH
ncbi:MAG TPA: carboxypeptidase-like regulatory domain-containing protein [Chitinophagaceae bacterium]|nr:carboxypeptidase-like regulatory domain-containing protein [Chitinophagaceae bacterium]